MSLFDIYSRAAGIARALIVLLTAVLTFVTAAGPTNNPVVAKIAVAITAGIELLTRFTGIGNKPPTVAPNAPAVLPQQP